MVTAEKAARSIEDYAIARLSEKNQEQVLLARPDASYVAGFRQWLAVGRCVKKGEHGTRILVPGVYGKDDEERAGRVRFVTGVVFDIAQTCELAPRESGE
jgi:hypothetical protein